MSSIATALSGLSTSCQGSLTSLLASNFATCVNVIGLAQVGTSSGSIISPLNSWITNVCTTSPCTTSDLASANTTLRNGCATDMANGQLIPSVLGVVIGQYNGVRDLVCTKYVSNNTYCVPSTLSAAQNATGVQVTLTEVTSLISGRNTTNFLNSIPTGVYCTDCGHAITSKALAIVQNVQPAVVDTVKGVASGKCGASFADGTLPSTVQTTATGNTSINSNSNAKEPNAAARGMTNKSLLLVGTLVASAVGTLVSL